MSNQLLRPKDMRRMSAKGYGRFMRGRLGLGGNVRQAKASLLRNMRASQKVLKNMVTGRLSGGVRHGPAGDPRPKNEGPRDFRNEVVLEEDRSIDSANPQHGQGFIDDQPRDERGRFASK